MCQRPKQADETAVAAAGPWERATWAYRTPRKPTSSSRTVPIGTWSRASSRTRARERARARSSRKKRRVAGRAIPAV
ncbi:hypothetical protein [Thermocatellispora tengchongensis]|uniref:hypothetical protein n=1 Tax=Thermocatellispora tengchongensis TaxID=1073253 RepID=UPI00364235D0